MPWLRADRFWGYGDPSPELIVLTDSILSVKGSRLKADATPIVQWILSINIGRTFRVFFMLSHDIYVSCL